MITNCSEPCVVDYDENIELLKTKHGICSKRNPIVESDMKEARDLIQILVDYKDKKKNMRGQLFKGNRSSANKETGEFLLKAFSKNPAYFPHKYKKKNVVRRLRLSKDISRGREMIPIPAYCDQNTKSAEIALTSRFEYLTENYLEDDAQQRERRKICYRCDCNGPCSDEKCPCIRLHLDVNCNGEITNVRDGRVKIQQPASDMYTYMLLVCGDRCSCPSSCPNRIDNIAHRLELFRRDLNSGFGIRTLNSIHMGELVMEFVGRVMNTYEINDKRIHGYAMELFLYQTKNDMPYLIDRIKKATGSEDDIRWNDMPESMHVDPYAQGSVSRFIQHGCYPNLIPLRVAANYLHPTEHKIYFFAARNIIAGEELFFNYGQAYVKQQKFKCSCGTPLCKNNPHIKDWGGLTTDQAIEVLLKLHKKWEKKAIKKDEWLESEKDLIKGKLDELPKETTSTRRIKDEVITEKHRLDNNKPIVPKVHCTLDKLRHTVQELKDCISSKYWNEAQEDLKEDIRQKAEERAIASSTVPDSVDKKDKVVTMRGISLPQARLGSITWPSPSSSDSGIGSSVSKSSEGTGSSSRSSPAEDDDEIVCLEVVSREESCQNTSPPTSQKRKLSDDSIIKENPKKPNAGTAEDPVLLEEDDDI